MSQVKVDRNKELKKNRKKIVKRQKATRLAGQIGGCVLALAVVGWLGYSAYGVYEEAHADDPLPSTAVDLSAISDYISGLDSE